MTDNKIIASRLEALREEMRREHLSAFIFPSSDPHMSEYVPSRWEGRKWISGFDGSAGTAVVTLHSAALWTDSRYFIAAEQQLAGTEFQLMRERLDDTPTIPEWIAQETKDGDSTEVGVDGMCMALSEVEDMKAELKLLGGLTMRTNLDILERVWTVGQGEHSAYGICRRGLLGQARPHTPQAAAPGCCGHVADTA